MRIFPWLPGPPRLNANLLRGDDQRDMVDNLAAVLTP
jgi:hypothetical protein